MGHRFWVPLHLQTVQWVLSLGVGGMLRRAGYWGPLATFRQVPGVLLPVEALLSLMDLTQHGCISLPVPIFLRRCHFRRTLHDRATSYSLPDALLAGMPVASSLRRSPRCLRMQTS